MALHRAAARVAGLAPSHETSAAVRAALERLVADGSELGLQCAAYQDGQLVVDTWAGVADPDAGRSVDGQTLFWASSTAKGVTATCLHVLAERGKVDYAAPVCAYWPEFAANGK